MNNNNNNNNSQRGQCQWFGSAQGCRFGDNCDFSHDEPESVALCKYNFREGGCYYGSQCMFRHSKIATKFRLKSGTQNNQKHKTNHKKPLISQNQSRNINDNTNHSLNIDFSIDLNININKSSVSTFSSLTIDNIENDHETPLPEKNDLQSVIEACDYYLILLPTLSSSIRNDCIQRKIHSLYNKLRTHRLKLSLEHNSSENDMKSESMECHSIMISTVKDLVHTFIHIKHHTFEELGINTFNVLLHSENFCEFLKPDITEIYDNLQLVVANQRFCKEKQFWKLRLIIIDSDWNNVSLQDYDYYVLMCAKILERMTDVPICSSLNCILDKLKNRRKLMLKVIQKYANINLNISFDSNTYAIVNRDIDEFLNIDGNGKQRTSEQLLLNFINILYNYQSEYNSTLFDFIKVQLQTCLAEVIDIIRRLSGIINNCKAFARIQSCVELQTVLHELEKMIECKIYRYLEHLSILNYEQFSASINDIQNICSKIQEIYIVHECARMESDSDSKENSDDGMQYSGNDLVFEQNIDNCLFDWLNNTYTKKYLSEFHSKLIEISHVLAQNMTLKLIDINLHHFLNLTCEADSEQLVEKYSKKVYLMLHLDNNLEDIEKRIAFIDEHLFVDENEKYLISQTLIGIKNQIESKRVMIWKQLKRSKCEIPNEEEQKLIRSLIFKKKTF